MWRSDWNSAPPMATASPPNGAGRRAELAAVVIEGQGTPVSLIRPPRLHEQLAAHAQMCENGVTAVERKPQVLATPPRCLDPPPHEQSREVVCSGNVTTDSARVSDRDVGNAPSHDPALQAPPDDLDLGELRHEGVA